MSGFSSASGGSGGKPRSGGKSPTREVNMLPADEAQMFEKNNEELRGQFLNASIFSPHIFRLCMGVTAVSKESFQIG